MKNVSIRDVATLAGVSIATVSHVINGTRNVNDTTRAAVEKGLCAPETLPRLLAALERYGLPAETDYPLTDILAAAEADKKRTDDVTKFIVPERVGHCRVEPVPADEVAGWLKAGGLR